uniref:Ig-like domain-containing protein n=1 Tax=Hucho hucho TaxID=62062 RepID=A0A4W5NMW8_9TELE
MCIHILLLFSIFNYFFIEMYPPIFSTKPDPMTLYVGKQATFQCVVTGSSPMTIVWHKDNIAISPGGSYQISSDKTKYSLQIQNLQLNDHGTYLCKASNSVGTATCSSELRVINKPSFIKTLEASVSSAVGNTLRLEGQVDEDTGVSITWMKDGKKLHQTMDCKQSFEDKVVVLEITKAKLKDSGKYVCTASNDAGSATCPTTLTVQEPPSLRKELQMVETVKGAPAVLECEIKGTAPFEITWFKNKKPVVATDKKYKIVSQESIARLEFCSFESLEKVDAGVYTCRATNSAGSEESSGTLYVKGL